MAEPTSTRLATDGYFLQPSVLTKLECVELAAVLGPVQGAGRRGLLAHAMVKTLATSKSMMDLVKAHLPQTPRPVRALFFDKSPEANWLVVWHQDMMLALRERHDLPGWGPWSVKDDVPHVQPPVPLLEQMLAVRLHLDDADATNGALKVIPSSHLHGRLNANEIAALATKSREVLCTARAGDALVMRPLLLHSSARSQSPANRRVLHIEFAGFDLPEPLEWSDAA